MSTTSILFDSPALHSLKRAQLVQLCKRHNIKASGKNVELVDRLKCHADSLRQGIEIQMSPFKSDQVVYDDDEDEESLCKTRPSDKWEVVMEGIEERAEEEEDPFKGGFGMGGDVKSVMSDEASSFKSSKSMKSIAGIVNEQGELGAGVSKSSITSSLKSIASSLGLKRPEFAASNPFVPKHALKRSANILNEPAMPELTVTPLSPTSPSALNTSIASLDRPVPGLGGRVGDALDYDTASSSDIGGTIRLITPPRNRRSTINVDDEGDGMTGGLPSRIRDSLPRLAPYKPAFEIIPPTPGWKGVGVWPISPVKEGSEGEEEEMEGGRMYPSLKGELEKAGLDGDEDGDADMSIDSPTRGPSSTLAPPSNAFVFGSPNPRHSTTAKDFTSAASSVLAEMNARLSNVAGTSANLPSIDVTLIQSRLSSNGGAAKMSESDLLNYQFGGAKGLTGTFGNTSKEADKGSVGWKFDRAHEKVFSKMEGIDAYYAKNKKRMSGEDQDRLAPLPANRKRKSDVFGSDMVKVNKGGAAGVKKALPGLPGAFGEEEEEEDLAEVEEPDAKRVRVSVAPTQASTSKVEPVPKPKSFKEIQAEHERLKKERESIKRTLELKKARRRSSKAPGALGGGLKTPMKKPTTSRFGMGVLASAKTLVKSVWNRGTGAGGQVRERKESTLLKPTSASAAKTHMPATTATAGSRTSSLSVPKASIGGHTTANGTASSRTSGIARFRSNLHAMGPPPAPPTNSSTGVRAGPTRTSSTSSRTTAIGLGNGPRKAPLRATSTASSRVSSTSTDASIRTSSSIGSRLFAPTASSLAKMREKNANAMASPTKIPRSAGLGMAFGAKGGLAGKLGSAANTKVAPTAQTKPKTRSIFTTPLPLRTQGASKEIDKENGIKNDSEGVKMNPITGVLSPSKGTHDNQTKTPSLSRKPRISRGKVIAKVDAQRATSSDAPTAELAPSATMVVPPTPYTPRLTLNAKKQKLRARSSIGGARRGSKALLGLGADGGVGAGGVLMSAKKRARRSEVVRRKSVKPDGMRMGVDAFEGDEDGVGEGSAMDLEVEA